MLLKCGVKLRANRPVGLNEPYIFWFGDHLVISQQLHIIGSLGEDIVLVKILAAEWLTFLLPWLEHLKHLL